MVLISMIRSIISAPQVPGPMIRTVKFLRELCSLSTPQFIIFVLGVSMLVVSNVHLPRRQYSDQLESQLQSLKSQEVVLLDRIGDTQTRIEALDKDYFYRREALRKFTGQNLSGERTLSEYLNQSTEAEIQQ